MTTKINYIGSQRNGEHDSIDVLLMLIQAEPLDYTTSSVLGTPDESRTDFRTSQGEVSVFRRGTGTEEILATQKGGKGTARGSLLARSRGRSSTGAPRSHGYSG
jgi:hypothetical protein